MYAFKFSTKCYITSQSAENSTNLITLVLVHFYIRK